MIWLCSYGGSGTNALADAIEAKGQTIRTEAWKKSLCHAFSPELVKRPNISRVYVYNDPRLAFHSMMRRGKGYAHVNLNKMSGMEVTFTKEKLISAMFAQYRNWKQSRYVVYFIRTQDLSNAEAMQRLSRYLGFEVEPLPKPKAREYDMNLPIFETFKNEIEYINGYSINPNL